MDTFSESSQSDNVEEEPFYERIDIIMISLFSFKLGYFHANGKHIIKSVRTLLRKIAIFVSSTSHKKIVFQLFHIMFHQLVVQWLTRQTENGRFYGSIPGIVLFLVHLLAILGYFYCTSIVRLRRIYFIHPQKMPRGRRGDLILRSILHPKKMRFGQRGNLGLHPLWTSLGF